VNAESGAGGRVVTFYSFKGGTGRSMALANIAHVLSLDRTQPKILMIDWDLEAPGLHRYFENALTPLSASRSLWPARSRKVDGYAGLIDLLETAFLAYQKEKPPVWDPTERLSQDRGQSEIAISRQTRCKEIREDVFANLDEYLLQCESDRLFLMKAGAFDPEDKRTLSAKKEEAASFVPYAERIRRFNWEEFHKYDPDFFPAFRRHLMGRFQYVLIDSRTGLTDSSGICTKQMPEVLILVFAPNQQNIDGLVNVVRGVKSYRYGSIDSRPVMIYPVASRIDGQYQPLRDTWRKGGVDEGRPVAGYQHRFEELLKDTYDLDACDLTAYFDLTQIPHDGAYAYGEKLAAKSGTSDSLSMGWRYANLAQLLATDRAPWEAGAETSGTHPVVAPTAPVSAAPTRWVKPIAAMVFLLFALFAGSTSLYRYVQQRMAERHAATARMKLAAGDAQGAVLEFSSAIQKQPDEAGLYRDRAYAFKILGKDQNALQDYDQVLSLQTDIPTLKDRAYMYRLLHEPVKSDADYQAVLRIAPKDMDALTAHAYLAREAGNYDEAIRAYTAAISQQASEPSLFVDRGMTFLLKKDMDSARRDFEAALRLDPNDAYARGLLSLVGAGRTASASDKPQQQATATPRMVTGWVDLGMVTKPNAPNTASHKRSAPSAPIEIHKGAKIVAQGQPLHASPALDAPVICTPFPYKEQLTVVDTEEQSVKGVIRQWVKVELSGSGCKR